MYHSVAPNPCTIRATIAHKILLRRSPPPTWDKVSKTIDKWVKVQQQDKKAEHGSIGKTNFKDIILRVKKEYEDFDPKNNLYIM